jgi:heat-inducible transcriptional repressor
MLSSRQEAILNLIVDSYVKTATPVASEFLARDPDLAVSPATVRNEVAHLEEMGYLTRPHASAGSVPVDKAYRSYVESLFQTGEEDLPGRVRRSARRRLNQVEQDVDEWSVVAASVLSGLVGNLAIATFPKATEARVRHIELVPLQDLLAMVIVVLEQARMRRHLIRLTEPVGPEEIESSSNKIKSQVVGLTRRQIESQPGQLTPLEEKLVDAATLILREEDVASYRGHYIDGLRNLLRQPEFEENERVRELVQTVEDGTLIRAVLEEAPAGDIVKVVIGQENRGDVLWPLSVVLCRYGIPDEAVGAIGAVGPTRMEYSRTITGVRFMSTLMSELVEGVHG